MIINISKVNDDVWRCNHSSYTLNSSRELCQRSGITCTIIDQSRWSIFQIIILIYSTVSYPWVSAGPRLDPGHNQQNKHMVRSPAYHRSFPIRKCFFLITPIWIVYQNVRCNFACTSDSLNSLVKLTLRYRTEWATMVSKMCFLFTSVYSSQSSSSASLRSQDSHSWFEDKVGGPLELFVSMLLVV
jgi:hypothetical protein